MARKKKSIISVKQVAVEKNIKPVQQMSLIELQPEFGTAWVNAIITYEQIKDLTEERTKDEWLKILDEVKKLAVEATPKSKKAKETKETKSSMVSGQ